MTDLAALDAMPPAAFTEALGDLFEHSPHLAERAAARRPFGTARALHDGFMAEVAALDPAGQLALIRAHPELAGREAAAGVLADASASEQARLGFLALSAPEHAELAGLNASYRTCFGFPCIIALAGHADRAGVLAEFRARLAATPEQERAAALAAIGAITRARLARRLGRAGGSLTLHALDTGAGCGAADLQVELSRHDQGAWRSLGTHRTDAAGRTAPLLSDIDMEAGPHRLDFHVGAYHRHRGIPCGDPAFLEIVPIAFGIDSPGAHYHVPLLFSPWSYSTYRGN